MPRFMTVAARIWLDPAFKSLGSLPPYPSPTGAWDDLFAAMEVESAERALNAVRLDLSAWRKPESGRSEETRAAFDEVVHRIDAQIEALHAFAWDDGPRPPAIEDLYLDALRELHRDLEIAGARGGASIAELRQLAVWIWGVIEDSGKFWRTRSDGPAAPEAGDQDKSELP